MLFSSLIETYDRVREKQIIEQVQQRKNNLRVVLVNHYHSGTSATGQIIQELAEDLSRRGVAVSIITESRGGLDSGGFIHGNASAKISWNNEL